MILNIIAIYNITLESARVYFDLLFLFPDCDDIGYYRDNITLESTRVYLAGAPNDNFWKISLRKAI